jgi:hypothetical protein
MQATRPLSSTRSHRQPAASSIVIWRGLLLAAQLNRNITKTLFFYNLAGVMAALGVFS